MYRRAGIAFVLMVLGTPVTFGQWLSLDDCSNHSNPCSSRLLGLLFCQRLF
jgi:hypothetical protein